VQPNDCASLVNPAKLGKESLDWRDTVALEHCDRLKRLWRLTNEAKEGRQPVFYDTRISAAALPNAVGIHVPLLRVVLPDRVFFDTGSAELLPAASHVIEIVAESLRRDVSDVAVFIAGHTDSRGGRGYNQTLSVQRADSVAHGILRALRERSGIAHVWRV